MNYSKITKIFDESFSSLAGQTKYTTQAVAVASYLKKSIYVAANGDPGDDDVSIDIEYGTLWVDSNKYQPDGLKTIPEFLPLSTAKAGKLFINELFPFSTEDIIPWMRVSITTGIIPPTSIDVWGYGIKFV